MRLDLFICLIYIYIDCIYSFASWEFKNCSVYFLLYVSKTDTI